MRVKAKYKNIIGPFLSKHDGNEYLTAIFETPDIEELIVHVVPQYNNGTRYSNWLLNNCDQDKWVWVTVKTSQGKIMKNHHGQIVGHGDYTPRECQ